LAKQKSAGKLLPGVYCKIHLATLGVCGVEPVAFGRHRSKTAYEDRAWSTSVRYTIFLFYLNRHHGSISDRLAVWQTISGLSKFESFGQIRQQSDLEVLETSKTFIFQGDVTSSVT